MEKQTKPKEHPLNKDGKQMRKLMRSVARYNMENRGVKRINAKRRTPDGKVTSYFATNWRRFALYH